MITDFVFMCLSAFFFWRGYCRGFIFTLLNPVTFFIALAASYIYYQTTENFFISLLIAIIGPFILRMIFSCLINLWSKSINPRGSVSLESRHAGALLNFVWGMTIALLTLSIIYVLPTDVVDSYYIFQDIKGSKTYKFMENYVLPSFPALEHVQESIAELNDPDKMEEISQSNEYQEIIEDKKVKNVLDDPETMKQIKNKDFGRLLANPKILEIYSDEDLIKKFISLQKRLAADDDSEPKDRKFFKFDPEGKLKQQIIELKERLLSKFHAPTENED